MLQTLNEKVEEVYRNCIGDNEANIRYLYNIYIFIYTFLGKSLMDIFDPVNLN